jgi:hypothetical protein
MFRHNVIHDLLSAEDDRSPGDFHSTGASYVPRMDSRGDEASAGHSLAVARTRYIKGRQALRNIRLPMNEALLAQEQVDLQRVQLEQEADQVLQRAPQSVHRPGHDHVEFPSRASRHGLSNGGRLSRPLAPLMP